MSHGTVISHPNGIVLAPPLPTEPKKPAMTSFASAMGLSLPGRNIVPHNSAPLETAQFPGMDQLDSSVFSIQISVGQFLLILLLVNELVLRPLQELFKDQLLYCAARSVVSKGEPVLITPAPRLLRAFGIENFVSSPDSNHQSRLWLSQIFRIVLFIFLVVAAAIFERSIDERQLATVSTFTTISLSDDSIRVGQGQTTLISPFPVFGLREQDASSIAPFQPSGTNSSSRYVVRENTVIASQYISTCVRQVNESYTNVFVGAVVLADGKQKVMCLDGTGGSDTRLAARFFSTNAGEKAVNIRSIKLSRLSNEKGFSSDGLSGVFAADVVDENSENLSGYITVTKRSHFDSDVVWSMYGLLRRKDSLVWRMNLPLVSNTENECERRPCFNRNPSLEYLGTWTFGEDEYTCPDETPQIFPARQQDQLRTASLEMFPASTQTPSENNTDLLAWLIETDFARFVAGEFFELELRSRVRSDRLFYTTHEGEEIVVTDGGGTEMVTMGRTESTVFLTAVALLLAFILVSSVWNCVQAYQLKTDSDVVSFQAVSRMYRSEYDDKMSTKGAAMKIGLTDTEQSTQHLGLLANCTASVRDPTLPLD